MKSRSGGATRKKEPILGWLCQALLPCLLFMTVTGERCLSAWFQVLSFLACEAYSYIYIFLNIHTENAGLFFPKVWIMFSLMCNKEELQHPTSPFFFFFLRISTETTRPSLLPSVNSEQVFKQQAWPQGCLIQTTAISCLIYFAFEIRFADGGGALCTLELLKWGHFKPASTGSKS